MENVNPSDDELNEAAAKLCGYPVLPIGYPDFCHDRNLTQDLFLAVADRKAKGKYWHEMKWVIIRAFDEYPTCWDMFMASPRMQAEAALRACNAWPIEWDAKAREEKRIGAI